MALQYALSVSQAAVVPVEVKGNHGGGEKNKRKQGGKQKSDPI